MMFATFATFKPFRSFNPFQFKHSQEKESLG
jgi:hypothetical protein